MGVAATGESSERPDLSPGCVYNRWPRIHGRPACLAVHVSHVASRRSSRAAIALRAIHCRATVRSIPGPDGCCYLTPWQIPPAQNLYECTPPVTRHYNADPRYRVPRTSSLLSSSGTSSAQSPRCEQTEHDIQFQWRCYQHIRGRCQRRESAQEKHSRGSCAGT